MNAIILTGLWGVLMMLGGVFFKKQTTPKYLAIAGTVVILAANIFEFFVGPFIQVNTHEMLKFTHYSLHFNTIVFGCVLLLFLLNGKDFEKTGPHVSVYFGLMFFALCGVSLASSFNTLLILFLSIEMMSVPLYILTGIDKNNLKGNEASLKYFLTGMFFTAVFLMGVALIYGGNSLGSFYINFINIGAGKMPALIAGGLVLIMIGMAFKASAAPFHFWAPDVYDGAPSVVTSFMSTIIKAAVFVAFIRLFSNVFGLVHNQWQILVVIIIVATLLIGNITAIFQRSVKRMLAYSAIAHTGFMMFAIFAPGDTAREGLLLYVAAYCLATIGMFAIVTRLNDYTIEGFNGLGKTHPQVALMATIFLLSLTGIPLTAGFTARLFVLMAAVKDGHHFWLVIFAALCAALSAVYYFRVIQAIYFKESDPEVNQSLEMGKGYRLWLTVIAILIILFGILPNMLIDWIYY